MFALVDDCLYEYLNQWKWFCKDNGYAIRRVSNGKRDKKYLYKTIYMHRVVNQTPSNKITDHINGNKLDNRIENLRTADKRLNATNAKIRKNNTTGVKGCYWEDRVKKWRLQIKVNYKNIHLGYFNKIEEAKLVRSLAEIKYAV